MPYSQGSDATDLATRPGRSQLSVHSRRLRWFGMLTLSFCVLVAYGLRYNFGRLRPTPLPVSQNIVVFDNPLAEDPLGLMIVTDAPIKELREYLATSTVAINEQVPRCEFSHLEFAIRFEKPRVVELLLKYGADPNRITENTGYSPLISAVNARDWLTVEMLLDHDADPMLPGRNDGLSARDYYSNFWVDEMPDGIRSRLGIRRTNLSTEEFEELADRLLLERSRLRSINDLERSD